jgi:hypothetical protein
VKDHYLVMSTKLASHIVDASQPLELVVDQVVEIARSQT